MQNRYLLEIHLSSGTTLEGIVSREEYIGFTNMIESEGLHYMKMRTEETMNVFIYGYFETEHCFYLQHVIGYSAMEVK